MALGPTKVFGIDDAKIAPLTSDDGTSISYGTLIDAPGIQTISLSPSYVEKELRGDEKLMDVYTKLEFIEWSFTNAKLSLEVLEALLGGSLESTGTTPDVVDTFTLAGSDIPGYFKLEGQVKYTDAGDLHVILYKCKANSVEFELQGEEYAVVTASGKALATDTDDKVLDIVINETATAIS